MVSSTLCPAVHILGSQNVYGRAEGIADHYWPWAVFYFLAPSLEMSFLIFQTRFPKSYLHIAVSDEHELLL